MFTHWVLHRDWINNYSDHPFIDVCQKVKTKKWSTLKSKDKKKHLTTSVWVSYRYGVGKAIPQVISDTWYLAFYVYIFEKSTFPIEGKSQASHKVRCFVDDTLSMSHCVASPRTLPRSHLVLPFPFSRIHSLIHSFLW